MPIVQMGKPQLGEFNFLAKLSQAVSREPGCKPCLAPPNQKTSPKSKPWTRPLPEPTHLQMGIAGTSCLGQVGGTSKMDSGAELLPSSCSQGPRNSTAG